MKRILIFILATAVLLVASQAQAQDNLFSRLTGESTIEKALERGVLRVGMSTFEPWAMKDKKGEFIGFEIDVATRLAKDMGVKLELVPTQWSGIIPALLTGKFDVIIGGMGIRADRALKVNFTEPYNYTGMAIVANKEVAPGADSLEDFNKEDVKLVVRTGSTGVTAAEKYMPEAKLLSFDSEPQALQELLSGNAHAYVSSAPKPAFAAYEFPDKLYLPVEGTFTREPNAMAIRKGDVDTLNYLNSWITMVGSEGWFAERYQYWFETRDWESKLP